MKLATHCEGKINDPNGTDKGWSVEMAIPREAIASEFDNYLKSGRWLRINFSRVEWQYELDANGRYSRKKGKTANTSPKTTGCGLPADR
nr:CAZy families CBM9 protein [uncultured Bacteroides sp.]